jgi:hypothetical protein
MNNHQSMHCPLEVDEVFKWCRAADATQLGAWKATLAANSGNTGTAPLSPRPLLLFDTLQTHFATLSVEVVGVIAARAVSELLHVLTPPNGASPTAVRGRALHDSAASVGLEYQLPC